MRADSRTRTNPLERSLSGLQAYGLSPLRLRSAPHWAEIIMPYQSHPGINTPSNTSQKIWRYLDFAKFMSLIENEALFFSNLTNQPDKMEGFLTKASVDRFRTFPKDITGYELSRKKQIREHNLQVLKNSREHLYISSWHMSDYESAAMWEIYIKDYQGIAIQTTIGRFMESLEKSKEDVYIGKINYLDREKDESPWNNVFFLALNLYVARNIHDQAESHTE